MKTNETSVPKSLLLTLGLLVFVRLVTLSMYPLMDNTEARYSEIARKMVELNDWITPWFDYHVPFWGKPPFSFWITAISFKLFGINEFAARFPHWLVSILIAFLIWQWANRRSHREAIYTIALLAGSGVYFVSAGAVMTDMSLLLGTTLAMRGFWAGLHEQNTNRHYERWLFFIGIAIGLLAKGPLTLVLTGVPLFVWAWKYKSFKTVWQKLPWLNGTLLVLIIALPWYVLAELKTPGFLQYFIVGEHLQRFLVPGWSGDLYGTAHLFPRGTIWLFALADLLPWTLLLPTAAWMWRKSSTTTSISNEEKSWRFYLLCWAMTPAIFFTAAGNILWPYILPGLPGLVLWLAAWLTQQHKQSGVEKVLTLGMSSILFISLLLLMILFISGQSEQFSTKALVNDYINTRQPNEKLVFVGKLPFSAKFYSQGQVDYAHDATELQNAISKHDSLFIAVAKNTSGVKQKNQIESLTLLSAHGKYHLFYFHKY